ncbi:hypothetical protein PENTCL1PPCAC_4456, partial [Pristionchus entomophagus]
MMERGRGGKESMATVILVGDYRTPLITVSASSSAATASSASSGSATASAAVRLTTATSAAAAASLSLLLLVHVLLVSAHLLHLVLHHVHHRFGDAEVLDGGSSHVHLGHLVEAFAVLGSEDDISEVNVHPSVARLKVAVVGFAIFQLDEHGVVLGSAEKREGK